MHGRDGAVTCDVNRNAARIFVKCPRLDRLSLDLPDGDQQ
jgi:hypothetical protein